MTTRSELFAKANLYEELLERVRLANDTDNMSSERSDEQIAAIEEMLPTATIECLHQHGGCPERMCSVP
jgi:hypothetical protein